MTGSELMYSRSCAKEDSDIARRGFSVQERDKVLAMPYSKFPPTCGFARCHVHSNLRCLNLFELGI